MPAMRPKGYRQMTKERHVNGIRIRTLNTVMIFISLLLFVVVFYATLQISHEYRASVTATEKYITLQQAAHMVHVGSDNLTEQARLYAVTAQEKHVCAYFEEFYSNRNREKALDFISAERLAPEQRASLDRALALSDELTHKEIYSIRLVAEAMHRDMDAFPPIVQETDLSAGDRALDAEGKIERARELLFKSGYDEMKKRITGELLLFLEHTLDETRRDQQAQTLKLGAVLDRQRIVLIGLCILNVLTFLMIITLIIKPLQIYLKCIKSDKMFELVGAYEFKHLALTYNDIFVLKEHHDKMLRHEAEHDPLTGLLNRRAFDSLRDLLRRDPDPMGFILIDVDHFKEVNDTYGHVMGDRILCRVAGLIKRAFRAGDFCIRLGGDEFAVILKGGAPAMEQGVAAKIADINNSLSQPEGDLPPASLSVGVAFSESGFAENLYGNADSALYAVKEQGRSGCAFYMSGGGISNVYRSSAT